MLIIEVLVGFHECYNPKDYFLKEEELFELSKQDATIKVRPNKEHSYLRDNIMPRHIDKDGFLKEEDCGIIHHSEGRYKFDYTIKINEGKLN